MSRKYVNRGTDRIICDGPACTDSIYEYDGLLEDTKWGVFKRDVWTLEVHFCSHVCAIMWHESEFKKELNGG